MADLITWFTGNISAIFISLINVIINYIINPFILTIASIFSAAVDLLPDYTPDIPTISDAVSPDFVAHMNWFLPIGSFLVGWGILVVSITARFVISPALRWFKLVR